MPTINGLYGELRYWKGNGMAPRRVIATVAVAVTALTGCSDALIVRGIVTGQEHRQEWTEMRPVKTCSGNPAICTVNLIPIRHRETWTLTLDDGTRKGQRDVTKDAYSRCSIGDTWPDCEQLATTPYSSPQPVY